MSKRTGVSNVSVTRSNELFGHVKGAFTGAVKDKKGLLAVAHQGTLFLDEVANTSLFFQSKLLRAIQEGEIKPVGATTTNRVDVRIIAATSSNLQEKVAAGEFREDLYYRLNVINVPLPPLRERKDDIRLLVEEFLKRFCEKADKQCEGFTVSTLTLLEDHHWPGNIRELENVIERAVALSLPNEKLISPELLPQQFKTNDTAVSAAIDQSQGKLSAALDHIERRMIQQTLEKHNGNRTEASTALGVTRQTLIAKIKKHQL